MTIFTISWATSGLINLPLFSYSGPLRVRLESDIFIICTFFAKESRVTRLSNFKSNKQCVVEVWHIGKPSKNVECMFKELPERYFNRKDVQACFHKKFRLIRIFLKKIKLFWMTIIQFPERLHVISKDDATVHWTASKFNVMKTKSVTHFQFTCLQNIPYDDRCAWCLWRYFSLWKGKLIVIVSGLSRIFRTISAFSSILET